MTRPRRLLGPENTAAEGWENIVVMDQKTSSNAAPMRVSAAVTPVDSTAQGRHKAPLGPEGLRGGPHEWGAKTGPLHRDLLYIRYIIGGYPRKYGHKKAPINML